MFMAIAITAIGIGIVVMIGYLLIGQVRVALPSNIQIEKTNTCKGTMDATTFCYVTGCSDAYNYSVTPTANTSNTLVCSDTTIGAGQDAMMTTAFAGFGLVAVGIIVMAAFGLIQVFQ